MSAEDAYVEIQEMLAHSKWVEQLAHSLVADPVVADDVVQDTWLAALRSPPRSRESIRGWLAIVVSNLARAARRKNRERIGLERLAAVQSDAPSTEELFLWAERNRELLDEVLALPAKYGEVVLLRFQREMWPREIATHLGLPIETVRTRLRRALEMLRAKLEARAGRDGIELPALLAPLLSRSTTATPQTSSSPGLGRRARIGIAAGLLVATAVVATLVFAPSGIPDRNVEVDHAVVTSAPTRARTRAATVPISEPTREDEIVPGAAVVLPGQVPNVLRLVPRWLGSAELARDRSGFAVTVTPLFDGHATPKSAIARLEYRHGAVELDRSSLADAVALDLVPDAPDLVPIEVRVPVLRHGGDVGLPVPPCFFAAAIVTGRIEPPGDGANALVIGFRTVAGNPAAHPVDRTVPAADGSFRVRLWPGEPQWVVVGAEGRAPLGRLVTPTANTITDLGSLHLESGLEISGRVLGEDGAPPRTPMRVRIQAPAPSLRLDFPFESLGVYDGAVRVAASETTTAADGSFRFGGLSSAKLRVSAVGCGTTGDLAARLTRNVDVPSGDVEFVLPPVTMMLQMPDAREGTSVFVEPIAGGATTGLRITGETTEVRASPGASYRLRRADIDGVRVEITGNASGKGESPAPIRLTRPEEPAVLSTELLVEVAPRGDVALLGIGVFRAGQRGVTPVAIVDAPVVDGVARVALPGPGNWRVVARPGTAWSQSKGSYLEETTTVEARADAPSRWSVKPEVGGRVRILCTDRVGRPASSYFRVFHGTKELPADPVDRDPRNGGMPMPNVIGVSGMTELAAPLPAGAYVLELGLPGSSTRTPFDVVAGEETLVETVLP